MDPRTNLSCMKKGALLCEDIIIARRDISIQCRIVIVIHNCDSSATQNCETELRSTQFGIVIYLEE